MKYKLLRDLADLKAGYEFIVDVTFYHEYTNKDIPLRLFRLRGNKGFDYTFRTKELKENVEWFAPVKEANKEEIVARIIKDHYWNTLGVHKDLIELHANEIAKKITLYESPEEK